MIDSTWFDGYGPFLDGLTGGIRSELHREPDTGDLLLTLGCSPESLAGRVLAELGVDLEQLASAIQRIRAEASPTPKDQIEKVRQAKELAIESAQLDDAARLRDEERRLTAEHVRNRAAVLLEIRTRLGISGRNDGP